MTKDTQRVSDVSDLSPKFVPLNRPFSWGLGTAEGRGCRPLNVCTEKGEATDKHAEENKNKKQTPKCEEEALKSSAHLTHHPPPPAVLEELMLLPGPRSHSCPPTPPPPGCVAVGSSSPPKQVSTSANTPPVVSSCRKQVGRTQPLNCVVKVRKAGVGGQAAALQPDCV